MGDSRKSGRASEAAAQAAVTRCGGGLIDRSVDATLRLVPQRADLRIGAVEQRDQLAHLARADVAVGLGARSVRAMSRWPCSRTRARGASVRTVPRRPGCAVPWARLPRVDGEGVDAGEGLGRRRDRGHRGGCGD
jgi:hypothetical protein